jgi:hypothetical protein
VVQIPKRQGDQMSLEGRLFAAMKESVGFQFGSFIELANKIHEASIAEFTYNRLDEVYVMQPVAIVPYISILNYLDLIISTNEEQYTCVLKSEPSAEGARELISRKAIAKLEEVGFGRTALRAAIKGMLSHRQPIMPGLREVYQNMSLSITETNFLRLTSLTDIRAHFGFAIITRRIIVPTASAKSENRS